MSAFILEAMLSEFLPPFTLFEELDALQTDIFHTTT